MMPNRCPKCGGMFDPFLRGQVARFSWFGLRKRIYCLICRACKEIVDYETLADLADWRTWVGGPARSVRP